MSHSVVKMHVSRLSFEHVVTLLQKVLYSIHSKKGCSIVNFKVNCCCVLLQITSAEQKRLSKLPPRLAKMKAEEIKERKQARLDRDSKESDGGRSGLGGGG